MRDKGESLPEVYLRNTFRNDWSRGKESNFRFPDSKSGRLVATVPLVYKEAGPQRRNPITSPMDRFIHRL